MANITSEHGAKGVYRYYDNLAFLVMPADAGEIDEFNVSQVVAEYVLNTNTNFEVCCVARVHGAFFAFGFRENDGAVLQKNFSIALRDMRKDGVLDELRRTYC